MVKNLVAFKNPKSRAAEAFRTLRTNIQFSGLDDSLSSIVVTSSVPSEGKSTVLINLAITIAQSGKSVLVVDCDLRRPTVHKKLGLPNTEGLTNLLIQEKNSFNDVVLSTKVPNLSALTSGPIPPNPAELLGTKRMKHLLGELTKAYDMVLIDAPPVIAVTDAQILSTIAEGTLIVSSYGTTEKIGLVKTKELLDKVGAKILGVVLNKVPEKSEHYYYGKYYTTYYKEEN
ncbi:MAG: CpsD/CapB family tyrosine-protein kinase [Clostridiales bacterium]|uniref:CpsD/CapB family tyrosine-protein kinase n=1 Tax=Clostridium sp. N3C TaxID=1776758 RepID=UPI00092DFC29|nr:CpsD/CapB family tyrosine-protein kinase [Clostridium sp. N3C]NLZ48462.1 CpsD/CapB family tyrosine-protein kinase [Clostridiales bacterium]SCN21463.1 Tyrosine-protein kinase YwqD [Clostridium sp. N3C]